MADDAKPIIKKVKKVAGHGHHGGAWKVAYADFVTAMMAFFLLMWLLNATSEEQRSGLAEYFVERIPLAPVSGGGDNAFNGDSMNAEGSKAESGKGAAGKAQAEDNRKDQHSEGQNGKETEGQGETAEALEEIEKAFKSISGESDVEDTMLRHIRTRVTDEGLVIDIFDLDDSPLFAEGGATPTPTLAALLDMIASVARIVKNDVAISGHVGAPVAAADPGAGWTLSTGRAHAAREIMKGAGLAEARVKRVAGHADTDPLIADRADARNSRIEVTLLR